MSFPPRRDGPRARRVFRPDVMSLRARQRAAEARGRDASGARRGPIAAWWLGCCATREPRRSSSSAARRATPTCCPSPARRASTAASWCWARDGARWLGFHSPIEREEAALTGMPLLDPVALEASKPLRGGDRPGARLAHSLGIALERVKAKRGRVAIAGRSPNGELTQALDALRRRGYSFVSGSRRDAPVAPRERARPSWRRRARRPRPPAPRCGASRRSWPRRCRGGVASAGRRRRGGAASAGAVGAELRFRGEPLTVGGAPARDRDRVRRRRARRARGQPDRSGPRRRGAAQHRQSSFGPSRKASR